MLALLLGLGMAWPGAARAQEVVNDDLTSADGCTGTCPGRTVLEGVFDADGWRQTTENAQIVYDLGPGGIDCGVLEVDLANYDPTTQIPPSGEDEYHFFLRLDEEAVGERCHDAVSSISVLTVRHDLRDLEVHRRMRLDAQPDCSAGEAGNRYTDPVFPPYDPGTRYRLRLEWSRRQASLWVTLPDSSFGVDIPYSDWWPATEPDPTLNLRYVFLGRDNAVGLGQPMTGPVWSNLRITAVPCGPVSCGDGACNGDETCDTCAIDCFPCPPVCGNGACESAENCGTCPDDCGTCPGEDAGPDADATDDVAADASDEGRDVTADARDAADDGGRDAGIVDEPEDGCGCRTNGAPGPAGITVILTLVGLFTAGRAGRPRCARSGRLPTGTSPCRSSPNRSPSR